MGLFKHQEIFIENLKNKTDELYSITQLNGGHLLTITSLLNKPKFSIYFLDGVEFIDGLSYSDAIFVFDFDIYVYLSKDELSDSSFSCKIYYPIRKKKDVEFFIINLKKLK